MNFNIIVKSIYLYIIETKSQAINMGNGGVPVCRLCWNIRCECKVEKKMTNSVQQAPANSDQQAPANSVQQAPANSTQ